MKRLKQDLNTSDDSFSYTLIGEAEPLYRVDNDGRLTKSGVEIGKFVLGDNQWHLCIDGVMVDSGPQNGLFKLPEFELKALTSLVNLEPSK